MKELVGILTKKEFLSLYRSRSFGTIVAKMRCAYCWGRRGKECWQNIIDRPIMQIVGL